METRNDSAVAGGTYADKQLFCKDRIVAWSHRSRFVLGRRLVEPFAGRRLLDYGCGDGTFLALVHDLFPESVGADVDPRIASDCTERFAGISGLSFTMTRDLREPEYDGAFGVVTCMEVLEHCVDDVQDVVLADLRRLLAPGGTLVISVPVEIGLTLVGKQVVRAIAGWRRLGDYQHREKYSPGEFVKMVLANENRAIDRPIYLGEAEDGSPSPYHGHKGFNWRALERKLRRHFVVKERRFSPLGVLGSLLNSQVWFVCEAPGHGDLVV